MRRLVRTGVGTLVVMLGLGISQGPALAQEGVVSGEVRRASDAAPLGGATVQVRGTDLGALVSQDGTFRISGVPAGRVTLVTTLVGYQTQETTVQVVAGEVREVTIRLRTSRVRLDELVASVEAAGVRREELGTDVVSIDAASEVEKAAIDNFTDLINARSGNVAITSGGGQVGSGSRIRIRGTSSITQDNVPLILVDGARVSNDIPDLARVDEIDFGGQTTSRFEDINPQDIETIEVVKGPTAATLYGSEAAAGVIVITTKKGEQGTEPRATFRTMQGWKVDNNTYPGNLSDLTAGFGVTDPNDPRLEGFDILQNPVNGKVFVADNPLMDPDTRPFRKGYNRSYAATVTGGGADVGYFGSAEYQELEGTLRPNSLERFRARANFGVTLSDMADVSVSTSYVTHDLGLVDTATLFGFVPLGVLGTPTLSFGNDPAPGEGPCLTTVLGGPEGVCDGRNGTFFTTADKLEEIEQGENLDHFIGSITLNLQPTEWLTVQGVGGFDEFNQKFSDFIPFDAEGVLAPFSSIVEQRRNSRTLTADFGATAQFDLPRGLTSTTSGGIQGFFKDTESSLCQGDLFSAAGIGSCDAAQVSRGGSDFVENVELGVFGQQRIGWNGWVFATGAIRADDNSALGEQADVIISPSANASVLLSEAPFWNVGLVNDLRLRAAWGQASQSPDQFAGDVRFRNAPTTIDGDPVQGLTPSQPGNPDLTAEETEEFEVGLDVEVLGGRVGGSFTYFDQETTDAIIPVPVAPSTGFPEDRFINLGKVENDGFEASVDARVFEQAFGFADWDLRITASSVDPVVTDLGRDEPIFFPTADVATTAAGFSQVFAEGVQPGAYVSQVVASASRDANGNITDFELAEGDPRLGGGTPRRVVGSPTVTNEQSLASTLTLFDRLRIFTLFDRDGGNDLLWALQAFRSPFFTSTPGNPNSALSERFGFRQVNETPETQAAMEQAFIEPFVFDGSFIRWRELTIRWDLPQTVADLFRLDNASLTLGGRNLHVFTDFPGPDPEGNITGAADGFVRNSGFEQAVPQTFFSEVRITF